MTQANLAARIHLFTNDLSLRLRHEATRGDVLLHLLRAAGGSPEHAPTEPADARSIDTSRDALAEQVRRDPAVLEQACRAANVTGYGQILVLGSEAVHAALPDADLPPITTMPEEADLAVANDVASDTAHWVEAHVGLGSPYQRFGVCTDGIRLTEVTLPAPKGPPWPIGSAGGPSGIVEAQTLLDVPTGTVTKAGSASAPLGSVGGSAPSLAPKPLASRA